MKKYNIKKVEKRLNASLFAVAVLLFCVDFVAIGSFIKKKINSKKEDVETLKSIEFSVNYDVYEVMDRFNTAVNNNKYLTDQEKELIRLNLWIFVDNKDYMDIDYLENALLTLKIKYSCSSKNKKSLQIKAEYFDNKNQIVFYNSNNICDVDYSVFTHELMHVMQKKKDNDYNKYLIETINTIFNEEYTSCDHNTLYSNYYNYTKMLIEIIGEEPFRKYQNYTSLDFIINELSSIYGTKKDAIELLEDLDEYEELYVKIKSGKSNNTKKMELLEKKIIYQINNYYQSKYGFSMDNDLIMIYYYDKNKFYELIGNKFFVNNININNISDIDYFYGNENHILTIYACGTIKITNIVIGEKESKLNDDYLDNYYLIYEINESNRYINNNYILKKHF